MPIYDLECPRCGHEWEAKIYKKSDERYETICHSCGMFLDPKKDQKIGKSSFRMGPGFAARNSYGLKKFDDGK